jgi:transcriptional regulator GlxA family with amidase domain
VDDDLLAFLLDLNLIHITRELRYILGIGTMRKTVRFGVFIYDGVEPIDIATYGVLSIAQRVEHAITICTIAPESGVVRLSNGLRVIADYGIHDAPDCDVLIVTGGPGWEAQAKDAVTLDFMRSRKPGTRLASVCTGAMILAASGVLDGKKATTKREVVPPELSPLELMRQRYPTIDVDVASLVDCGGVTTGGGVSLCIDVSLHIIERELGTRVAQETARILEYSRAWEANRREFPSIVIAQPISAE